jgi:hypothetical protein
MKRADSLSPVASSRMQNLRLPSYRRASTDVFARRYRLQSAQPTCVQPSCLERKQLAAVAMSVGDLAASNTAATDHRRLEHMRLSKAEGKTKGGGTRTVATPVCTWGRRGTRRRLRRAVDGIQHAPMPAFLRASHASLRLCLLRAPS